MSVQISPLAIYYSNLFSRMVYQLPKAGRSKSFHDFIRAPSPQCLTSRSSSRICVICRRHALVGEGGREPQPSGCDHLHPQPGALPGDLPAGTLPRGGWPVAADDMRAQQVGNCLESASPPHFLLFHIAALALFLPPFLSSCAKPFSRLIEIVAGVTASRCLDQSNIFRKVFCGWHWTCS